MNLILTPIKHGLALKKEITFCRREGGKNLKASNPPEKKKKFRYIHIPSAEGDYMYK